MSGEFLAQKASNEENVFIRWRHHVLWLRPITLPSLEFSHSLSNVSAYSSKNMFVQSSFHISIELPAKFTWCWQSWKMTWGVMSFLLYTVANGLPRRSVLFKIRLGGGGWNLCWQCKFTEAFKGHCEWRKFKICYLFYVTFKCVMCVIRVT